MDTKNIKSKFTENNKKTLGIIAIILLLLFFGALSWFVGRPMINFVSEPEKFRIWVDAHGMMVFQVVLALIPGEPLEIGAGYAFGAFEGTLLAVIGTVLGTAIVFFLVKKFGIKFCEIFFSREKLLSLKILKNKKKRDIIAFLVFFLPGTPKDLLTYFLGLTDIKFSYVLFLSSIARLPSVITSTLGGDALGVRKYATALIVFAITGVISLCGVFVYRKFIEYRNNR